MRRLGIFVLSVIFSFNVKAAFNVDSLFEQSIPMNDTTRLRYYLKAAQQIRTTDYRNCLRICAEIIRLAKKNNNAYYQGEAMLSQGLSNYFAGEYDQTLQCYLEAIHQFEKSNTPIGKAQVLNELGIFYRRQKNPEAAKQCFVDAFALGQQVQNKGVMATATNNQGLLAQDKQQHKVALAFFTQAQELYTQINDKIGISYTYDYASVSYAAQGVYKKALTNQQDAYSIRLQEKDSNAASLSLLNLAEFEIKQQHNSEAIRYLQKCIALTEQIKYKDLTAYAYKLLAESMNRAGNAQLAYQYHARYATLNEEIFNSKRSQQISDLQTKYETAKKVQEIALLRKENELKESKYATQRNIFLAFIGLFILGAIAYYHYAQRKKQREVDAILIQEKQAHNEAIIAAEEKERIRIARDLHDGVSQTMIAAKMQLESFIEKNNAADPSLKNAFDLVKDAAHEVRAISHSMVPNALLKSGLIIAIRDFVHKVEHGSLKVDLQIEGLQNRLDENVETVVFRVLQELVNNIVKHAKSTNVVIQLIHDKNELTLMVEDNGVGFDAKQITSKAGMGVKNIMARVSYLNGKVHFDSTPGHGTTVVIEIPLSNVS